MMAVHIGCRNQSVRHRLLEVLILLVAIVLPGCSFTGMTHDARVNAFNRDMRTVEIGPLSFPGMTTMEVVAELYHIGNETLVKVESPYGFSMRCLAPESIMNYRRDWDIPQMPILHAFEYVCSVCGASMKFEDGVILIYSKDDEDFLFKSSKKDEAEKEPSEEESKRRDELMRTVEIGPADFLDMPILDAIGELHELGDDALKKAGWNLGLEIVCGGYGRYEEVTKRDWHIPRSPILKACAHLCRLCDAKMEYTNGAVVIIFENADNTRGISIDSGEIGAPSKAR